MMEYREVILAKYVKDYVIEISFNTGERYLVDFQDELHGEVFEPLRDLNILQNFTLNPFTIEWPNGADFSPNHLYHLAIAQQKVTFDPQQ